MKPVAAGALLANRQQERAASRARVEHRAQLDRYREAERKAHDVLKDAIVAVGVPPHVGIAILAAADSLRKTAVNAALAERIEPEPSAGETLP